MTGWSYGGVASLELLGCPLEQRLWITLVRVKNPAMAFSDEEDSLEWRVADSMETVF